MRSRRPLDPAEPERFQPVNHFFGVEQEVLHPQRDALAHGRELRRLEVGVGEAGQGAVLARDLAERHQHRGEPTEQQLQPLPHQQEVGVIGHVGAGSAEVEIGAGGGCLLAERVDVRHDVVAQALLVLGGPLEIHVVEVPAQLRQGLVGNRQAQLLL